MAARPASLALLVAACAPRPAEDPAPARAMDRTPAVERHLAASSHATATASDSVASAPPLDPTASSSATAAATPRVPLVVSVGQTTWVRKKPEVVEGEFLGYVRTGYEVPLRSSERVRGEGCPAGFYQVAPRGYVCADRTVTESPRASFLTAALATRPSAGAFPYRYGLSDGSPMYNRVPTAKEQERYERWLGKPGVFDPLPKTLRSHEELAEDRSIASTGELPRFLDQGGSAKETPYDLVEQTIPLGAMLSFTESFEAEGRTFLLSTDHTIVPADRVRPFRPSKFRGTELGGSGAKLPLAWMRVDAKPKYVLRSDEPTKTGETWGVRTFVELTGRKIEQGTRTFLETRESRERDPLFIDQRDATVVESEERLAAGVKEGQKWFMIRLTRGTLVAYEGLTPTYATLVSPGKGGVPVKGNDPVEHATTPLGAFSVTFKDRYATMSPETGKNRSFWIQDVPHTMYFDPPFALHAAFWHERFGEFVSAGCINLSPLDAERLFDWADPALPPGWQGVTGAGARDNGATTIVVVRR